MDPHHVVIDILSHVVVSVSKEPYVVPMVFANKKTMEHLLYISKDSNLFLSEADQNSQNRVVKVPASEEHIRHQSTGY